MLYDKLIAEVNEEGISDSVHLERIKKLQETIKAQSHLYDDHGSAIIGSRGDTPIYPDD